MGRRRRSRSACTSHAGRFENSFGAERLVHAKRHTTQSSNSFFDTPANASLVSEITDLGSLTTKGSQELIDLLVFGLELMQQAGTRQCEFKLTGLPFVSGKGVEDFAIIGMIGQRGLKDF